MSILYHTQPLATSEAKYVATYLGEVLMVLSKGIINMKQLEDVLTEPTCQPRFRLFLLNPDETIGGGIANPNNYGYCETEYKKMTVYIVLNLIN